MFWVTLALFAASFVIQALLSSQAPKAKPGDAKSPRATEGDPIPVVFGTCKVAPNAGWFGDVEPRPIKKASSLFSKSTVGYNYYAGMMGVLCHGPVDAIVDLVFDDTRYVSQAPPQVEFTGILLGLSPQYTTVGAAVPAFPIPTTGADATRVHLSLPYLYGGQAINGGQDGGVIGDIDLYFGTTTQTPNDYLYFGTPEQAPAFGGYCYFVARHLYWGDAAQLKAIHAIIRRCPSAANGSGTARVQGDPFARALGFPGDDANPAEIIWDCLTDTVWGKAMDPAALDRASFQAAANTLYSEGLGLSFLLDGSQGLDSVIEDIFKHIDGVLYLHPTTGLLTLALMRADYGDLFTSLPQISPANAHDIAFTRSTTVETLTEMKVTYTARLKNYASATESWQNLAVFAGDGGHRVETMDLPWITTPANALAAAARLGKAKTLPLGKADFKCNRSAFAFRRGGAFLLTDPENGVGPTVMRVIDIDYGTLEDGEMTVSAVEDLFSIAGQTLVDSGGSSDAGTQPAGGFGLQLSVEPVQSQTATVGSLELAIDDPNGVVTDVAFQPRQGATAGAGFVSDATAPYQATVTLVDGAPSYIDWRVQYTDVDGTTQELTGTAEFSATIRPQAPRLSVAFDAGGVATIDSHGDGLTATQKIAYSLVGYPDDATTRAAAVQTGRDVTITGPTLTQGQTLYVAAFAYDASGNESLKAVGAFPLPVSSSTGRGEFVVPFLAGDRIRIDPIAVGYAEVETFLQAWVDLTGMQTARLVAYVDRAASPAAVLAVRYSLDGATWTYLDGALGTGPTGGPAVFIDTLGPQRGDVVLLDALAQRDVILQLIARDGDGVARPRIGTVLLEVSGQGTETNTDHSTEQAGLLCYVDEAAFDVDWHKIITHIAGEDFAAAIGVTLVGAAAPCTLTLGFTGGGKIFGDHSDAYYRRNFTGVTPLGTVQVTLFVSKVSGYDLTAMTAVKLFGGGQTAIEGGAGVTNVRTAVTLVGRAGPAGSFALGLGEWGRSPVENGSLTFDTLAFTEINLNPGGLYVLTATPSSVLLYVGQFIALAFAQTLSGSPVTATEVLGYTDDINVAAVGYLGDGTPYVGANDAGTANANFRTYEGAAVTVPVQVEALPGGVDYVVASVPRAVTVDVGASLETAIQIADELTGNVPASVVNRDCTLATSDAAIAIVSGDGVTFGATADAPLAGCWVKGVAVGTATITITHTASGKTATLAVTVQHPVTDDPLAVALVQCVPEIIQTFVGHFATGLFAAWNSTGQPWNGDPAVAPGGSAALKPITAVSSNPAIATAAIVYDQLQVTGVAVGSCTITLTETGSGVSVVIPVTVS